MSYTHFTLEENIYNNFYPKGTLLEKLVLFLNGILPALVGKLIATVPSIPNTVSYTIALAITIGGQVISISAVGGNKTVRL